MLNVNKYKNFIIKDRVSVSIYALVIVLFILPRIPYVNIFVEYIIPVLFWIASITAIGFNATALFRLGIVMFFLILLFTLFGESHTSEIIASGTYFILFTATLLYLKDLLKEK
jgi:hypothetical protein